MLNKVGKCLYERQKPSLVNLILNLIIILICLVFIVEIIFNTYYTNIYVKGRSMMPTLTGAPSGADGAELLPGGDYVFVDTHVSPDYFDIVVVQTTDDGGFPYDIIKRVIAFGGDTVKLDRGTLLIKYKGDEEFTKIDEPYIAEGFNDASDSKNTFGEHLVKDDCMFLLGDNRNESADSREKGDFPIADLVGVVPKWSIENKSWLTSLYTFFEFTLGFNRWN